jgi:hypothetical protein
VLTSDESHGLVANGVLESEVTKDGRKTAHWRLDFPCPSYLACIAAGEVRIPATVLSAYQVSRIKLTSVLATQFELYPDETVDEVPIAYIGCKGVPEESVRPDTSNPDRFVDTYHHPCLSCAGAAGVRQDASDDAVADQEAGPRVPLPQVLPDHRSQDRS